MIDENSGAWSMLEESVMPGMPSLEDLDPETVANAATSEAFQAEEPMGMTGGMGMPGMHPMSMDPKEHIGTMLKQQRLQKCASSKDFQNRAQMMNKGDGK